MHNAIFDFGNIVNGNIMEYSTDFSYSGWKHTKSPDQNFHNWYDVVEIGNNSSGFRCDEFIHTNEQTGKHILFSGCSVTWGDALNKEDTWPYMLYQELSKDTELGGYFNIGFPGSSMALQIFWMMRYFKKYGNPDCIFFFIPNLERFMSVDPVKDDNGDYNVGSSMIYKEGNDHFSESFELSRYFSYEMYLMLDQYCKSNNIKLISSSWSYNDDGKSDDKNTTTLLSKNFDTFFEMDPDGKQMPYWVYQYMQRDNTATIKALDGEHPGKAMQAYYAHKMLDRYREIINENNRI